MRDLGVDHPITLGTSKHRFQDEHQAENTNEQCRDRPYSR